MSNHRPQSFPCPVCGVHGRRELGAPCAACYVAGRADELHNTWFWSKVDASGDCWIWTGKVHNGYGAVLTKNGHTTAHRHAYELLIGPIPDGLHLDHRCRTPLCVNPAHMEPVTRSENARRAFSPMMLNVRKTHCPQGHPYNRTQARIQWGRVRTYRVCRTCFNARRQARRARLRAAA